MRAEVFTLLGMIIDTTVSDNPVFYISRENDALLVECDDTDIITGMILPLCNDKVYQFLERCNWFVAILKITKNHIAEIIFENDLGESSVCDIGEDLLNILADWGVDDTYLKICQEITKKCVV